MSVHAKAYCFSTIRFRNGRQAKDAADYVSDMPGGKQCVRKTIEMVMKAQEKWEMDLDIYHQMF